MALIYLKSIGCLFYCIVICSAALETTSEGNTSDLSEVADLLNLNGTYIDPNTFKNEDTNTAADEFLNGTNAAPDTFKKVEKNEFTNETVTTIEYSTNITETTEVGNLTGKPEAQVIDVNGVITTEDFSTAASAVILAVVFVMLAATGYGVMIAYRKVLQVRYDNSQMLITDDVYDISDLRNFEI